MLTFKVLIITAAGDNFDFFFFFLIFQRKQVLTFHVNCLPNRPHEMSRLIFSVFFFFFFFFFECHLLQSLLGALRVHCVLHSASDIHFENIGDCC